MDQIALLWGIAACGLPNVEDAGRPPGGTASTDSGSGPGSSPVDTGVRAAHDVVTIAGEVGVAGLGADGPALGSELYFPSDLAIGADGLPYVMDYNNHRIRRLETDGTVTTVLAGSSTGGTDQWLAEPTTGVFAPDGTLYLVESLEVKRVQLDHTYARFCEGDFGVCDHEPLLPTGVALDPQGRLLVADALEGTILRLDDDGVVRRIAGTGVPGFNGDGPALETQLFAPYPPLVPLPISSRIEVAGDILYIADTGNNRIRALDLDTMEITTVAGGGRLGSAGDGGPAVDADLSMPDDVAIGPDGALYLTDWSHSCIRVVRDGVIDTLAGVCADDYGSRGSADAANPRDAQFFNPFGVVVDPAGALFVADTNNEIIRRITLEP